MIGICIYIWFLSDFNPLLALPCVMHRPMFELEDHAKEVVCARMDTIHMSIHASL